MNSNEIRLYITESKIAMHRLLNKENHVVFIHRKSHAVTTESLKELNDLENAKCLKPLAILGMLAPSNETSYLIIVTSSQIIGSILGREIYLILKAEIIQVHASTGPYDPQVQEIEKLLCQGFYYSYDYNLSERLESQILSKSLQSQSKASAFSSSNHQRDFKWNYYLVRNLHTESLTFERFFAVYLISGYVNCLRSSVNYESLNFMLISRWSVNNAGTRFNARGINEQGYPANYIETEIVLTFNESYDPEESQELRLMSHVKTQGAILLAVTLVRGSAPVFFTQSEISQGLEITNSLDGNLNALNRHIARLTKDKKLLIVNLLNVKKTDENTLTLELEKNLQKLFDTNTKYFYFNFEEECKNDDYSAIESKLVGSIRRLLDKYGCLWYNSKEDKVLSTQGLLIRFNCLDCLDRTNVVQARVAWEYFLIMVH